MAALQTEGLVKRYGALLVTDSVSLDIRSGELHAVIGPNGAGKTTLINQLSGELASNAGRVRFDGHDVTTKPVHQRARAGLLPYAAEMQLLLTGEPIDAAEAWRIGLINQVVTRDEVMPRAMAIARRIERNGPLAVRAVKRTTVATSGMPLVDAYALETAAKLEVLGTADAREGPRTFIEKREPRYEGR